MSLAIFDSNNIAFPRVDLGKVWSFLKVAQGKVRLGERKHYSLDPVRPEDREGLSRAYASIADDELEVRMPPGPSGYVHFSEDGQRLIYVAARCVEGASETEELKQLKSVRYVSMSVGEFDKIITTKTSRGRTSRHLVDPAFEEKLGAPVSADDLKWIAPRVMGSRQAQRALLNLSLS